MPMATTDPKPAGSAGNPPPDLTAHRHAELIESLWRISTGIEALHVEAQRTNRHLVDLGAKVESTLRFFVRAWQHVRGLTEEET